jgi:alpha-glucuronidase
VGYNRGAGGYGATYSGAARAAFTSLDACPEELLLSFFNVPYTHALRGARYGGRNVLQWIYESHAAGAAASAGFVGRWAALQGGLAADPAEFSAVAALLGRAAEDAAAFAATVVGFFVNLTGVPP